MDSLPLVVPALPVLSAVEGGAVEGSQAEPLRLELSRVQYPPPAFVKREMAGEEPGARSQEPGEKQVPSFDCVQDRRRGVYPERSRRAPQDDSSV